MIESLTTLRTCNAWDARAGDDAVATHTIMETSRMVQSSPPDAVDRLRPTATGQQNRGRRFFVYPA